jgi:hypothetical protein
MRIIIKPIRNSPLALDRVHFWQLKLIDFQKLPYHPFKLVLNSDQIAATTSKTNKPHG